MSIDEIVESLGGPMKVAQFLYVQTGSIRMWKHNGNIPRRHRPQLLALANKEGVQLTMEDILGAGWTKEVAK